MKYKCNSCGTIVDPDATAKALGYSSASVSFINPKCGKCGSSDLSPVSQTSYSAPTSSSYTGNDELVRTGVQGLIVLLIIFIFIYQTTSNLAISLALTFAVFVGVVVILMGVMSLIESHRNPPTKVEKSKTHKVPTRHSLKNLLHDLESSDAQVREKAANDLGELGDKKAVVPLIARLQDPNFLVLGAAIKALGHLKDARAIDALLPLLDYSGNTIRVAVVTALTEIGDSRVSGPLCAWLEKYSSFSVGIDALGKVGDSQAVGLLLSYLRSPGYILYHEEAVNALESIAQRLPNTRAAMAADLEAYKQSRPIKPGQPPVASTTVEPAPLTVSSLKIAANPAVNSLLEEILNHSSIIFNDRSQIDRLTQLENLGSKIIPNIEVAINSTVRVGCSISRYENAGTLCEMIGKIGAKFTGTQSKPGVGTVLETCPICEGLGVHDIDGSSAFCEHCDGTGEVKRELAEVNSQPPSPEADRAFHILKRLATQASNIYEYRFIRMGAVRGLGLLKDQRAVEVFATMADECNKSQDIELVVQDALKELSKV